MRAVLCTEYGGPDSLTVGDTEPPELVTGGVRVRVGAVGVNFPDLLMTRGEYQFKPPLTFSPGGEICGGIAPNGSGFRTRGLDGTYAATDTGQRPYNVVGEIELPSGDRTIDRWFNTDAVKPATGPGDVGNDCRAWKFTMPGFKGRSRS